jgi:hypothetical protein
MNYNTFSIALLNLSQSHFEQNLYMKACSFHEFVTMETHRLKNLSEAKLG